MLTTDVLKSLISEVFEPLRKHYHQDIYSDSSFHKIFGIYKIAILPLLKDEHFDKEFYKLSKIYTNKNLILDEDTKNFFEMFLFLYFRWLKKRGYNERIFEKLKVLLELDKLSELTDISEFVDRLEDFCEILAEDLIKKEGMDRDEVLDIMDMIYQYKIMSENDEYLEEIYIDSIIEILESFDELILEYDELKYLHMILKRFIRFLHSMDIKQLDLSVHKEIKLALDDMVENIGGWLKDIFIDKKNYEVTYIESYMLSILATLEILARQ